MCRQGDRARWEAQAGAGRVVDVAPTRRPLRLAWEQTALPRLLNRMPVDVHHGPHYTMPLAARGPSVVTVHDLSFFSHPEWHQPAKVAFFRGAIRVAAARAAAIVAVSHATAERLDARTRPRGPVHVIPHGVDHDRFRPAAGPDEEEADVARPAAAGDRAGPALRRLRRHPRAPQGRALAGPGLRPDRRRPPRHRPRARRPAGMGRRRGGGGRRHRPGPRPDPARRLRERGRERGPPPGGGGGGLPVARGGVRPPRPGDPGLRHARW